MDVLLDSNVYLEDVRLAGNQFTELFTYLRRTASRLLLPHLVREEVASRYTQRLRDASRKAQSAHQDLWKLTTSKVAPFTAPDLNDQLKAMDERMHSPSKGVKVVDVDDYSPIDFKELVNRGVQRKRPANENGEELRDVILWLLAVELAKKARHGIILISNDKGFKADDGRSLHPDLVKEVASLDRRLEYYPNIRECVVAQALEQKGIGVDEFYSAVPPKRVEELTLELMLRSQTRVGQITTADIKELEFEEATNYTVGKRANFIEARFHGSASISAEEFGQVFTSGTYSVELSALPYLPESGSLLVGQSQPFIQNALAVKPIRPSGLADYFYGEPTTIGFLPPLPRKYSCSFRISFSARVREGHLESIEPEGIQFTSFLSEETPGA